MLAQHRDLAGPGLFGDFGGGRPGDHEPDDRHVHQAVRQRDRGHAGLAGLRDARRRRCSSSARIYYLVADPRPGGATSRADAATGEAVDRLTRRLWRSDRRRGGRPARRRVQPGGDCDDAIRSARSLRGELRDELVAALQRVPELAGRRPHAAAAVAAASRTATSSCRPPARDERCVIRLAGNDTHLLGISREVEHAATVAAAGVGVGPEVIAVHPARGLPRHPVHRGRADRRTRPSTAPDTLAPRRRLAAPDPRRPADPGPVRPVPDRRGLPGAGRGARRHDPARVRARPGDRPPDRARAARRIPSSSGRATTTS